MKSHCAHPPPRILTINAHLLKYSMMEAKQLKMHSAMQAKIWASPFSRADWASALRACTMATRKLPKQMEPKLVVMVRIKLLFTAEAQQPHSSGAYHQVPTVPATTTWIEFYIHQIATQRNKKQENVVSLSIGSTERHDQFF